MGLHLDTSKLYCNNAEEATFKKKKKRFFLRRRKGINGLAQLIIVIKV